MTVDIYYGPSTKTIMRRVTREFTDQPVSDDKVKLVLEAARWAPSAGNRRISKFIVVRDPRTIRLVKSFAPGMLATPDVFILICTDLKQAAADQVQIGHDYNVWIDVGTTAMSMMVAAQALGLGSCPATSLSRSGVGTVLELPDWLVPEFILQLGYPAPRHRVLRNGAHTRLRFEELTSWERYGQQA